MLKHVVSWRAYKQLSVRLEAELLRVDQDTVVIPKHRFHFRRPLRSRATSLSGA
jgi:hypothetical protein